MIEVVLGTCKELENLHSTFTIPPVEEARGGSKGITCRKGGLERDSWWAGTLGDSQPARSDQEGGSWGCVPYSHVASASHWVGQLKVLEALGQKVREGRWKGLTRDTRGEWKMSVQHLPPLCFFPHGYTTGQYQHSQKQSVSIPLSCYPNIFTSICFLKKFSVDSDVINK